MCWKLAIRAPSPEGRVGEGSWYSVARSAPFKERVP